MSRRPTPVTGRRRQAEIFVNGMAGRAPTVPVSPAELEEAARRAMSAEAFAYVAGGAGAESTMRQNREAFERWRIVPRMLRDVSRRDWSVDLFGTRIPAPILLAPIGVLDLAHPEADLAVARAAAELGVPFIFSSQASVSMEETASVMGDAPRWFQLYWSRDDAVVESFVARAEASSCGAIVLTLDTTLLGWRPRDLDLAYLPFLRGRGIAQYTSDPAFLERLAAELAREPVAVPAHGSAREPVAEPPPQPPITPATLAAAIEMARRFPGRTLDALRTGRARAAVSRFIETYSRPSLEWKDLAQLREMTRLPILLKGVLHPDDARQALDHGVDGIIISNHGGRQVDGAIATIEALPAVADAVGGKVPILLDSGVRTGADVFRALALGATAVLLGRPYVYGLALAGEKGVREVVTNTIADFDLTAGLAGCRNLSEVTREMVV